MKKYVNGEYIELTQEEIAKIESSVAEQMASEHARPMTMEEVVRLTISKTINAIDIADNIALRMVEFYPEWSAGQAYTAGYKAQRGGKLWRCLQAHTAQTGWEPENAASLWTEICESHDGTKYDPIPYNGNMALTEGLYYTQGGVTYLCNRSTGQPVYNALAELVGLYVEVG